MVSCYDPVGFDSGGFDVCAGPVVEGVGGGRYKLIQRERRKLRFRTTALMQFQHILEERQHGRAFIQHPLSEKSRAVVSIGHRLQMSYKGIISPIHKLKHISLNTISVSHPLNEKRYTKQKELLNIRYLLFKLKQKLEEL